VAYSIIRASLEEKYYIFIKSNLAQSGTKGWKMTLFIQAVSWWYAILLHYGIYIHTEMSGVRNVKQGGRMTFSIVTRFSGQYLARTTGG
jgi:hypothetical protein